MIFNMARKRQRHLQAAEGYLSLGMPDHALDALTQVPDSEFALEWQLLRGDALRAKQEHHQALECFERALELDPKSLDALLGMAWCFKRIDRLEKSIESMRIAYEHHPKVPIVLYNLSCYYALAGNKDHALSWLGRALRMNRSMVKLVPEETDFDSLRNDPDFQHLLELSSGE